MHATSHSTTRKHHGWSADGVRAQSGQELLIWFPWEGMGKQGSGGLGLASLNSFGRL